ncbi:iron ABC transporter permease [Thalassobius sp. Cn5-15]|uniref:FecCD family ABC transporter permease n=1 Tax=Thalassobius sp. Cn5-15 TaxID=2917763 RepID=UPI001EF20598|nr:iron ABC transporter permease [Thalassobius sp. Cn5-15]MCG7495173.1 iron ABC transporter permease [Thalassobius sp. Cn5-15]
MAVADATNLRAGASRVAGDRRRFSRLLTGVLAVALALAMLLSLGWGAADQTDVLAALIGEGSLRDQIIIWDIRMPRMLTAVLVGASLAVSGAVMQGLFRNPLADPGLVGVSAGAGFGAVMAIVLGSYLPVAVAAAVGKFTVPFAAFVGGWVTTLLLYAIATRGGRTSVATMLLAGIALGALIGAFMGLMIYYADDNQLRDLTFWSMGSVAGASWEKLGASAPLIIITLIAAPFLARALNALTLGEAAAHHLGIDVQKMKFIAIMTVAASIGASTAITGGIGFVGIVVPHLLRLVQGPDHRGLLVNGALLGAIILLFADAISRVLIAPAELPIGIVMAAIGGPFFLWILLKNRNLVEM